MEELASVFRAGSETPKGGVPWAEHSLRKMDIWEGGWGSSWSSLIPSPLPQAQALDIFLDPTLFENRKAEGEAGWSTFLPVPAQIPTSQRK